VTTHRASYLASALERLKSARHLKRLRRKCEARLVAIHNGKEEWNAFSLLERLSILRGRPIHLIPMAISGYSLHGAWISTAPADLIIYEARTTGTHQEHIIAHELAHILCGHQAETTGDNTVLRQLFPDIAPEVVRQALQRTEYSDRNEQEAEMTASLLLAPIRRSMDTPPPLLSQDDEVVLRLRAAIAMNQPTRTDPA
jgi:Zn-dependent peptidase ImmA (M78 family)